MRKARVALVGVMIGGILLFATAATANAKEFQFQGGSEPFGSNPPVGMTIEGKDYEHLKRLTGFTVEATFACQGGSSTNNVLMPLSLNLADTKILKDKKKQLTYFDWSFENIYNSPYGGPPLTLSSYQLIGGQHRKHPEIWRGKVRIRRSEGGIELGYCPMEGANENGYVKWEAELVGQAD
jgi:hypothetical protein